MTLAGGWCDRCQRFHGLPSDAAREAASRLCRKLERDGTIILNGANKADQPTASTQPLFGTGRGKMFGALQCLDRYGNIVWLFAFSGQFNGRWSFPDWAPPLFDLDAFDRLNTPAEERIKQLGRQLSRLPEVSPHRERLRRERLTLSQKLMKAIHALYVISDFRGNRVSLHAAFGKRATLPTGTGDCCAPKLLGQAAALKLAPVSLAEFFFGRTNRAGTRLHGNFYPPCDDKCRPLLGFMLCGADEMRVAYASRPANHLY